MAVMQSIGVIPAAGRSVRMGRAKLLLPWRSKLVIEHVLEAWRASQVTHVVVVLRADDAPLAEVAGRYAVDLVKADPAPDQMKDSVALGLAQARQAWSPGPEDVWLLAPADMPRLSPQVIDRLLEEHQAHRPQILVPRAGGKNGHPVLFPWTLAAEVERLLPDEGINALRDWHGYRTIDLNDSSIFDDLDTPDDYAQLGQ
jgi:molybdenum cofactor cytidylyltransferase